MPDLKSKPLIVLKGILFAIIASLACTANLLDDRLAVRAAALVFCVWAACRFYYFLFYVLEKYVDASLRYAGIFALFRSIHRRPK